MMRVAFFTHHFLEPTHHALAEILGALSGCAFSVFAKTFTDEQYFRLPNVVARTVYTEGPVVGLTSGAFDLAHAVFDGKTALRAAMAAQIGGLPFVLSFHGGHDTNVKIFDPSLTGWICACAQRAEAVTVVSPTDVDRLRSIGINRPIDIIPVPIDLSLVPKSIHPRPGQLVSVGRLIPKKGHDVAIRALALLSGPFTLSIIGSGPCELELRTLVAELGLEDRVTFLGLQPLSETLSIVSSASVLVHAARVASDGNAEGCPQIVLWAQAMGVPVVATRTGGIPTLLEHQRTGLLVSADHPQMVAEAVVALTEDRNLRDLITASAHRRAIALHGSDRIANLVEDVYQRAVNTRRRDAIT